MKLRLLTVCRLALKRKEKNALDFHPLDCIQVWLCCVRFKQSQQAFGCDFLDQVGLFFFLLICVLCSLKYCFVWFNFTIKFSGSFSTCLLVDEWQPLWFMLLIAE